VDCHADYRNRRPSARRRTPGAGDIIFDGYGLDAIDGGTGVDTVYLCPDSVFDRLVSVEKIINSYLGCS
jgi:hypothetical protein